MKDRAVWHHIKAYMVHKNRGSYKTMESIRNYLEQNLIVITENEKGIKWERR